MPSDTVNETRPDPIKHNSVVRADIANENLRAQLHKLQYELDTLRQERELETVKHQTTVRKLEQAAEIEFKRAQTAEAERTVIDRKREDLVKSARETATNYAFEKTALDRNVRDLQARNAALAEQITEVKAESSTRARQDERVYKELESRHGALLSRAEGLEADIAGRDAQVQSAQVRLKEREREVGELEAKVLVLEKAGRDGEAVDTIKRQLSEQVAHIRKVEGESRTQAAELRALREQAKSVAVVEEEKRELATKLKLMEQLRTELGEAQLQRQILEDEKRRWTSYLDSSKRAGDQEIKDFESPEDMARAFVAERIERLSLVDKLGSLRPELAVRDEKIKTLQDEKARLATQLQKSNSRSALKTTNGTDMSDDRVRARLERQVNLSAKQIEYLRAQIKAFEAEEGEFGSPQSTSKDSSSRIADLEVLVEDYRAEIAQLNESIRNIETAPQKPDTLKRTHQDDESEHADERLGELRRKTRAQQDSLERLETANKKLQAELSATTTQLSDLRDSTRTRVLELRKNPTSEAEAIKTSTLKTLREENAALLAQLTSSATTGTETETMIPLSTLTDLKTQMHELEATIAQRDKKADRLKKIWSIKFQEFAAAVESTLGWRVSFLPNGRFKVQPACYKTHVNEQGEEEENSILFDGEQATMKVSGGTHSKWEAEIRPLIEFWVDGREQVPCFLAALQLELFEKVTAMSAQGD